MTARALGPFLFQSVSGLPKSVRHHNRGAVVASRLYRNGAYDLAALLFSERDAMKRRQQKMHQLAAIHELAAPIAKPRLYQWTQYPGWWRLRGAILSLTRTNRESIELRFVVLQERIQRESRELDRQCRDLISDALEKTVESLLEEREADQQAG
jgi:hypothetical protein